jgi:S1-C subfamily serine protease
MNKNFDVFLSHNSKDKPAVRELAEALRARGVKVWLDEWELVPGRPWQEALEEIIETTRSSAVLVGKDGLGPWQDAEMRGCLSEFVERKLPVIPVLLPGAPEVPRLPFFLKRFTWVDLRGGLTEEGLNRLEWGATGKRPSLPTAIPKVAVAAGETQPASAEVRPAATEMEVPASVAQKQPVQKARTRWRLSAWIGLLVLLGTIVLLLNYYFPRPGESRNKGTTAGSLEGEADAGLSGIKGDWSKIASLNRNSIVLLKITAKRYTGSVDLIESTGFIVHSDGYVLTCNRTIPPLSGSDEYRTIDLTGHVGSRFGSPLPLKWVLRNEERDLALIKLPQGLSRWRSVDLAGQGKTGSRIIALGFPYNTDLTAVSGLIASTDGKGGRWLTNAEITPGMAGSPVFDENGAVSGILAGHYDGPRGLGVIIPIHFAADLLEAVDSPLSASWRLEHQTLNPTSSRPPNYQKKTAG